MTTFLRPWQWYFDRGGTGPCMVSEDVKTVVWYSGRRSGSSVPYHVASPLEVSFDGADYTNRGEFGCGSNHRREFDLVTEIPAYVEV